VIKIRLQSPIWNKKQGKTGADRCSFDLLSPQLLSQKATVEIAHHTLPTGATISYSHQKNNIKNHFIKRLIPHEILLFYGIAFTAAYRAQKRPLEAVRNQIAFWLGFVVSFTMKFSSPDVNVFHLLIELGDRPR
jgi:hypothetical protein